MFFLYGASGTGETFIYKTVCHQLLAESVIVICTASSSITALLLPGGQTAHSMFKIPIDTLSETSFCSIPKQGQRAQLLRAAKLIIWDEALMHHRHTHEALDQTLRDLRDQDSPFGGMTVVFGGDLRQILPIVPAGTQEDIVNASLQKSYFWTHTILKLWKNEPLDQGSDQEEFTKWLLRIKEGQDVAPDGTIAIPQEICV